MTRPNTVSSYPAAKTARRCADMSEIRTEIDRLDRLIVPLLAERLNYVGQAAAYKPNRAEVVVHWRIEDVVTKVRALAVTENADPDTVERIYRGLIDASIAWEGRNYDRTRNDHR
ncbi:chorismate mutase [Rhodospirillum rubrum]|uniref:chorismate mutase n=1 Tax=Rhodospirillum rubrum (strain ATCC 11170 / ATH 1.1.1 / DSM 467 / LMG 4362 / NCIMB 8255 / S1) TaxID=269796 RepID=Q2RWX2_RHORT|nr:chorismate mutase [Rhodospirillum rubrum]ABC21373.1 chorismate mutase [Rhodospirillum rubrum ATCC 11170]AEO47053.1 chorismate mutase [Rhodospirillum rubrum F11]MBK5952966.1 chorismate mutase [Rhodospirillum rubrum]QXG81051.1 chorismate mutase [Rhodospirillum rubrum]HAQ00148.1 chorismate mutase [Rhodospirillum rubrum]